MEEKTMIKKNYLLFLSLLMILVVSNSSCKKDSTTTTTPTATMADWRALNPGSTSNPCDSAGLQHNLQADYYINVCTSGTTNIEYDFCDVTFPGYLKSSGEAMGSIEANQMYSYFKANCKNHGSQAWLDSINGTNLYSYAIVLLAKIDTILGQFDDANPSPTIESLKNLNGWIASIPPTASNYEKEVLYSMASVASYSAAYWATEIINEKAFSNTPWNTIYGIHNGAKGPFWEKVKAFFKKVGTDDVNGAGQYVAGHFTAGNPGAMTWVGVGIAAAGASITGMFNAPR
jgi:hypothetical protein